MCGLLRYRDDDSLDCPFVLYLLLETFGASLYGAVDNDEPITREERWDKVLAPWRRYEQLYCKFRALKAQVCSEYTSVLWAKVHQLQETDR